MLAETIPTLDDDQLKNLLANARRLVTDGADRQRLAAEELLPAIEAEVADRAARKPAPKTRKTPVRKKAVVEVEADAEEDAVAEI